MLAAVTYEIIETPIGFVGLAWSERGLVKLQLPERNKTQTKKKLASQIELTSGEYKNTKNDIIIIKEYLEGKSNRLDELKIALDEQTEFRKKVYLTLRKSKPGKTLSYKDLSEKIKNTGAIRAIGSAMGKNPLPLVIPCHRVVKANGELGEFSAFDGQKLKGKLIALETAIERQ